ncbi:Hsp20/alpha crystallin family protein [Limibacter armeniacum]|uniref:Hsp20/alpha crystallin family protein n=1 Tax=Limibacter armeniacum TaxID=466084 RepID=UPI002FE5EB16
MRRSGCGNKDEWREWRGRGRGRGPIMEILKQLSKEWQGGGSFEDFMEQRMGGKPAVNIREMKSGYKVEVYAAGYSKSDFKVEWSEEGLKVSSEGNPDILQEGERYKKHEYKKEGFKRMLHFSEEVDEDGISASYENGVLTILLPKVKQEEEEESGPVIDIPIE